MTDMQLPDDLRERVAEIIMGDYEESDQLDLIAPILLAEGAKQQREIDAGIADKIKGSHYPMTMGWASGERVAAAIRNQEGQ